MFLFSDLHLYIGEFWRLLTAENVLGAIGAVLYVISMGMKTVIPLRITSIASAFFLLLSAYLGGSLQSMLIYAFLLPLHFVRLYQMLVLLKNVKVAANGDLSLDWLQPYMSRRRCRKGEVLFRKGDEATEMFLVVSGRYLVVELNVEIQPGQFFGELGLLTAQNFRTHTVECIKTGRVMTISYNKAREIYFENPTFGFHLLRLSSGRLLQNLDRAEQMLAVERERRGPEAIGPDYARGIIL
jgi:CRP-like cAMP-binding protein